MKQSLIIGWLYPELMSTYGDRGNIIVLQKRCEWRGIGIELKRLDLKFSASDLKKCNILFMGGAQDQQQKIVSSDFSKEKVLALKEMIEAGIPGLYICGAYQFLGKYYKEANGDIIKGLNILNLYTENPGPVHPRLIGNIAIRCHPELVSGYQTKRDSDLRQNDRKETLIGFENHGGRTYLGKEIKPLGNVLVGFGNNGEDKTEGAVYKNTFGTYLHGPILPKNPQFADLLITLALRKKYNDAKICITDINNSLEEKAKDNILQKLKLNNTSNIF
ncbi:MAG: cobalamin biosynthesis protein CobQ [Candidatus Levybacteria bacterium]|nr:cobalamin biosynthesis protein CobQ [Candidatus Levybacteria bacterium]